MNVTDQRSRNSDSLFLTPRSGRVSTRFKARVPVLNMLTSVVTVVAHGKFAVLPRSFVKERFPWSQKFARSSISVSTRGRPALISRLSSVPFWRLPSVLTVKLPKLTDWRSWRSVYSVKFTV